MSIQCACCEKVIDPPKASNVAPASSHTPSWLSLLSLQCQNTNHGLVIVLEALLRNTNVFPYEWKPISQTVKQAWGTVYYQNPLFIPDDDAARDGGYTSVAESDGGYLHTEPAEYTLGSAAEELYDALSEGPYGFSNTDGDGHENVYTLGTMPADKQGMVRTGRYNKNGDPIYADSGFVTTTSQGGPDYDMGAAGDDIYGEFGKKPVRFNASGQPVDEFGRILDEYGHPIGGEDYDLGTDKNV